MGGTGWGNREVYIGGMSGHGEGVLHGIASVCNEDDSKYYADEVGCDFGDVGCGDGGSVAGAE